MSINFIRPVQDFLRSVWIALSILIPWFARFAWFAFKEIVSAYVEFAKGMGEKSRELSEKWITKMNEAHLPLEYYTFSSIFLTIVGFLMNLFGWVFISFVTVTVIRLLIGR